MVELERGKDLDGVTCRERWTWRKGGTWRDERSWGWGEGMGDRMEGSGGKPESCREESRGKALALEGWSVGGTWKEGERDLEGGREGLLPSSFQVPFFLLERGKVLKGRMVGAGGREGARVGKLGQEKRKRGQEGRSRRKEGTWKEGAGGKEGPERWKGGTWEEGS